MDLKFKHSRFFGFIQMSASSQMIEIMEAIEMIGGPSNSLYHLHNPNHLMLIADR